MVDSLYETPEANLETDKPATDIALWNPDTAGAWSILFTPIFGSILVRKNWIALGETKKASVGTIWIVVSIIMGVSSVFLGALPFLYLIIWYFFSQKKQTIYIKSTYSSYTKKGWLKPIGIAVLWYIGFIALIYLVFQFVLT